MTDPDLVVQIALGQQKLLRQLANTEAKVKRTADKIQKDFRKANQKAAASFTAIDAAAARTQRNLDRTFAGLQVALLSGLSARAVQTYADEWTVAGNKIAAASEIAGRSARSLEDINAIAEDTRSGIRETADLYAKLLRATKDVAKSELEVARATEIVNKAFKAGGAAASEQAAGILQLAQGLSSGILQGDELRSIRENAPLLAQAIADEFDTTIGKLKELGADGELTADRVFSAIIAAGPDIERAFSQTNATIAESFQQVRNALVEYIGAGNDSIGATRKIAAAMTTLAENIDLVVAAGAILGGRFLGPILGALLVKVSGNVVKAATGLLALGRAGGAAAAGLAAARGGIALLGGPVGALIAGLTALPLITESVNDRLTDAELVGSQAAAALDRFADASRRAWEEQQTLGGQVSAATQQLLNQSRVALQDSLKALREDLQKTLDDLTGEGILDLNNLKITSDKLEFFRGDGEAVDLIQELGAALRAAGTDAEALANVSEEMERLAGIGRETLEVVEQFDLAVANPIEVDLEGARDDLQDLADVLGGFESELGAIANAEGADAQAEAFARLRDAMEAAALTGAVLRRDQIADTRKLLEQLGATQEQVDQVTTSLTASAEELEEMRREAAAARAEAERLGGASRSIDFSSAALSASVLADQLERAVENAGRLGRAQVSELRRSEIERDFATDPVGRAAALAREEFDSGVGRLAQGGDSTVLNVIEQERRAFVGRAVAIAQNREEEQKLRDAQRSGRGGGGGGGRGRKSGDTEADDFFSSLATEIAELEARTEAIGKTREETIELEVRQRLLNEAQAKGLDLTAQYGSSNRTLAQEIDAHASKVASLTTEYEHLAEQQDFVDQQIGNIKDGILDAIVAGEDFKGVLADVAKAIARAALQAALFGEGPLATLFGQPAGEGLLSGLFASGGYTGDGPASAPAGIVHKGEYVFSKRATQRIGPGVLEAMHQQAKAGPGYMQGGLVAASTAPAKGGGVAITVHENAVDGPPEATIGPNGEIDLRLSRRQQAADTGAAINRTTKRYL